MPGTSTQFLEMFGHFLTTRASAQPVFHRLLKTHFGADPSTLPVVSESFELADHPNVHRAVEAYTRAGGRHCDVHGVVKEHDFDGVQMTDLVKNQLGWAGFAAVNPGPVTYKNVTLHDGSTLPCFQTALITVGRSSEPLAILFSGPLGRGFHDSMRLDVMAATRSAAEQALREIRELARKHNVFRGHLVSLSLDERHQVQIHFHALPTITREDVILPTTILQRIERQSLGITRHREVLRRTRRHLKRGLLLYGAPGTGKTLSAMYLVTQMEDRTVLLVTGRGMGLIEKACQLARLLAPSTVILEDVDLVAEDRRNQEQGCAPVLFELLNEMDGLRDDADVLFVLTTNRPAALEPALAARPGRVDQAIELPLPDDDCRRRLMSLYGKGLTLKLDDADAIVQRTQGVSGAFIKEMMRRAVLLAADAGEATAITDVHVCGALKELLSDSDQLTRTLLGATIDPH